jgi:adenosylcobinamide-GDP ribazoletransferase
LPLWLLPLSLWGALVAPCLILAFLILLMKRRLQGYTGDCCGATFLMCEMAFYLSALILI